MCACIHSFIRWSDVCWIFTDTICQTCAESKTLPPSAHFHCTCAWFHRPTLLGGNHHTFPNTLPGLWSWRASFSDLDLKATFWSPFFPACAGLSDIRPISLFRLPVFIDMTTLKNIGFQIIIRFFFTYLTIRQIQFICFISQCWPPQPTSAFLKQHPHPRRIPT